MTAGFTLLCRLAALALVVAILGLPINHLFEFALAAAAAVFLFAGSIRGRSAAWLAAVAIAGLVIGAQVLLAPPMIEEGENVFLDDGGHHPLASVLPADVYRRMSAEFDALYPPQQRCAPNIPGCWRNGGFPDTAYAFSADGIYDDAALSRLVTGIDFDNAVWLRIGALNDKRYNWYAGIGEVQRVERNRPFWMGFDRWRVQMPWYVVYRLPAAYADSELCWRGEVMWEKEGQRFEPLGHAAMSCRTVTAKDTGRRIFGLSIKPNSLAMRLMPPLVLRVRGWLGQALMLLGVMAVLMLLVQVRARALLWPAVLIGLALLVIAIDDASFIGGLRPLDGGDDGLFYDGVGRHILQSLLGGNWLEALRGGESIYYYGGPGLRYFRAIEKLIFGETYLGYLSLVLLFPFAVFMLWRRFLSAQWALCLALLFVATPLGVLFGTSFVQYAALAARGFADPAAYILFVCGLVALVGRGEAPSSGGLGAAGAALLLALAICMKPIVAPAAGVLLAGAGLAALYHRRWGRVIGLCAGFTPVLLMPLHNWYFGGKFVPLSSNANLPSLLVMPPSAWLAAFADLLHGRLSSPHLHAAGAQIVGWLSGPSHLALLAPLGAAAVAVAIFVAVRGRAFDPWLRLIAAAALVQQAVALFYATTPRYHFLAWLLTFTVVCVWLRKLGLPWVAWKYPRLRQSIAMQPASARLTGAIDALQRATGLAEGPKAGEGMNR